MNLVRVLIVEDNSIIAESIVEMFKQNNLEVAGVCDSGEEAIQKVEAEVPDLILMDIKLSGSIDGIEAAKAINDKFSIPIIYLSDYTDQKTIDRAKKTFPANYLAKPFNEADLLRAIEIALYNANTLNKEMNAGLLKDHVFLRDSQTFSKFAYSEILFLKAGRSYCEVITDKGKVTLSTSLNHVHSQLDNKNFVRVHRSWVININRLTKVEGNRLFLDKHEVPIGREHREELLSQLKFIK